MEPFSQVTSSVIEAIDDLLRVNVDKVAPGIWEDDEFTQIENPVLGDWVMMTAWIDQEGETHYVQIASKGFSDHAKIGLGALITP